MDATHFLVPSQINKKYPNEMVKLHVDHVDRILVFKE